MFRKYKILKICCYCRLNANKYHTTCILQKARELGIPVIAKPWIEDVWKKTYVSNIEATDIINEYKVPIFYNLKVTASGLPEEEKNKIRKFICDNGNPYNINMLSLIHI